MIGYGKKKHRRGSIIVMVAFVVSSVAFLSLAMMMTVSSTSRGVRQARESIDAMYVCEAGLGDAVFDLANGGTGAVAQKGYGKGSYQVASNDLGAGMTSLTSTGTQGETAVSVELVVRRSTTSFFSWAAFGDEGTTMDSNAMVDSYDSSLGTYAAQATNGSGSSTYANENGDVGSNGGITLSANAGVHGDAQPGSTSSVTINGNLAYVTGSTAPATSATTLPPIVVPVIASSGSQTISSDTTIPSGDHGFDDLTIDGNVTVTIIGPATLVTNDFYLRSNAQIVVDATNGPVEFFVTEDFIIDSNTSIASTTLDPLDVQINLLSDNVIDPNTNVNIANVAFNSNSTIHGTIYAPSAAIDIDSNFELFGSVIARRVHLDSNAKVHYDENLMGGAAGRRTESYETVCWRIVPIQ